MNDSDIIGTSGLESELTVAQPFMRQAFDALDKRLHLDGLDLQLQIACFDIGDVEYVVDQGE